MIDINLVQLSETLSSQEAEAWRTAKQNDAVRASRGMIANVKAALFGCEHSTLAKESYAQYLKTVEKCVNTLGEQVYARQRELITHNHADSSKYKELEVELQNRKQRFLTSKHLCTAADNAANKIEKAISACNSASSSETLDFLTKSKMISALSSMDTDLANQAIKDVKKSLRTLRERVADAKLTDEFLKLSDTLDFFVDILIDWPIDVFSLLNLDRIENALKALKNTKAELGEVQERLNLNRAADLDSYRKSFCELEALAQPYDEQAVMEVPANLRQYIHSAMRSRHDPALL